MVASDHGRNRPPGNHPQRRAESNTGQNTAEIGDDGGPSIAEHGLAPAAAKCNHARRELGSGVQISRLAREAANERLGVRPANFEI
jgi:hypothetical protein